MQDQLQRCFHSLAADLFPVTGKMIFPGKGLVFITVADEDCPHRITVFVPAGACKAGDGNRDIRIQNMPGSGCHLLRNRAGNRPKGIQRQLFNTQDPMLHLVAVAYDSALINRRAAGNSGQRRADSAAGAALCGDEGLTAQTPDHLRGSVRHGIPP